ncbi:hypothetical protein [Streptomyces goshikiensis]|uniref:hypothetical protein n=1 Tax=Streptomyces goshikiensis TaxID=1942 RepID=UPI0036C8B1D9
MPDTAWPEGVIARYLTKAAEILGEDITVDVIDHRDPTPQNEGYRPACGGCGRRSNFDYAVVSALLKTECVTAAAAERAARDWAQSHAETCRAMPRPTA